VINPFSSLLMIPFLFHRPDVAVRCPYHRILDGFVRVLFLFHRPDVAVRVLFLFHRPDVPVRCPYHRVLFLFHRPDVPVRCPYHRILFLFHHPDVLVRFFIVSPFIFLLENVLFLLPFLAQVLVKFFKSSLVNA
jgi:hypothetical protein